MNRSTMKPLLRAGDSGVLHGHAVGVGSTRNGASSSTFREKRKQLPDLAIKESSSAHSYSSLTQWISEYVSSIFSTSAPSSSATATQHRASSTPTQGLPPVRSLASLKDVTLSPASTVELWENRFDRLDKTNSMRLRKLVGKEIPISASTVTKRRGADEEEEGRGSVVRGVLVVPKDVTAQSSKKVGLATSSEEPTPPTRDALSASMLSVTAVVPPLSFPTSPIRVERMGAARPCLLRGTVIGSVPPPPMDLPHRRKSASIEKTTTGAVMGTPRTGKGEEEREEGTRSTLVRLPTYPDTTRKEIEEEGHQVSLEQQNKAMPSPRPAAPPPLPSTLTSVPPLDFGKLEQFASSSEPYSLAASSKAVAATHMQSGTASDPARPKHMTTMGSSSVLPPTSSTSHMCEMGTDPHYLFASPEADEERDAILEAERDQLRQWREEVAAKEEILHQLFFCFMEREKELENYREFVERKIAEAIQLHVGFVRDEERLMALDDDEPWEKDLPEGEE